MAPRRRRRKFKRRRKRRMPIVKLIKKVILSTAEHKYRLTNANSTNLEFSNPMVEPHQQGWIQFINKKRLGGVKAIFDSKSLHLEPCRGTAKQNNIYCAKDKKFTSLGPFNFKR